MERVTEKRGRRIIRSLPVIVVRGLSAVLLVASMETLLVQWTSHAVPPGSLAIDFALTATMFAMLVVPIASLLTIGVTMFSLSLAPGELSFGLALVLSLCFYEVSRIRTEKLSLLGPAPLLLMAILGIACWVLLRRSALYAGQEKEGSRPSRGASAVTFAHLIVAATAATWATLHIRGRFT